MRTGLRLAPAALLVVAVVACQAQSQTAGRQPAASAATPSVADPDFSGLDPAARQVELTYKVAVAGVDGGGGAQVTAWIPLPADNDVQTLKSWRLLEDHPVRVVEDGEFGNPFVQVDLSDAARTAEGEAIPLTLEFSVERRAYSAWQSEGAKPLSAAQLAAHLEPDRLVPTDGFIAEEARDVVGETQEPLEKANRLYEHVVSTLDYDKSGEGWGQGDAVYACDVRRGNCTDFHSLFMAEARSVGVPAEFVIGVPLPADATEGEIPGYHCWAEFYVDGRGWVPVDASEAFKQPDKRRFFFGGLDAHRVEFTTGRDLDLPGASVQGLNYVIYPHVEVDGAVHPDVETAFHFRENPRENPTENASDTSMPQAVAGL